MASPKSSASLAGCTVALAGSHTVCSELSQHSVGKGSILFSSPNAVEMLLTGVQGDLKTSIADQGGVYSAKFTDDCTHLVANQKQYDAKGVKGELGLFSCKFSFSRKDILP